MDTPNVTVVVRGGVAALVPAAILAGLFVASDPSVPLVAQAQGLLPVVAIEVIAGVIASPIAAGPRRRLTMGAFAFAVAMLAVTALLGVAQAIADVVASTGVDLAAIVEAASGRAAVALVSALYLILPFAGLGLAWSLTAHALGRVRRSVPA